jgi:hypothetical protein
MLAAWYEDLAVSAPETKQASGTPFMISMIYPSVTEGTMLCNFADVAKSIPSLRPSDDDELKTSSTESQKEKEKRKSAVTKRDYLEAAADLMTDVQVSLSPENMGWKHMLTNACIGFRSRPTAAWTSEKRPNCKLVRRRLQSIAASHICLQISSTVFWIK